MTDIDDLIPHRKRRVIDLLAEAGVNISDWGNYKGANASQNPKAYNWSFEEPGRLVVLSLWHRHLEVEDGKIIHRQNMRMRDGRNGGKGKAQWKARAQDFDERLQQAYILGLPVRVILCDGQPRDAGGDEPVSSKVLLRDLDPAPWAVSAYDFQSGDSVLTRGDQPVAHAEHIQPEFSGFEGEILRKFVLHRRREAVIRDKKIADAKFKNNGKLICEVPRCGFDFEERYGAIGKDFAHVHHLIPLSQADEAGRSTSLNDLAIVCANCHAMIHIGGQCRPLDTVMPIM